VCNGYICFYSQPSPEIVKLQLEGQVLQLSLSLSLGLVTDLLSYIVVEYNVKALLVNTIAKALL